MEYTGSKVVKKKKIGLSKEKLSRALLGKYLGEYATDLHLNPKVRQFDAKVIVHTLYTGTNWIYFIDKNSDTISYVVEVEKGVAKRIREYEGGKL